MKASWIHNSITNTSTLTIEGRREELDDVMETMADAFDTYFKEPQLLENKEGVAKWEAKGV